MDFFERQDKARRSTTVLVFYFALAVVLIVAAVNLGLVLVFGATGESPGGPQFFLIATAATLVVIFLGSLFKILELAKGGSTVALMLGGRPLATNTINTDERKLLNVVEEMSIASGVPVPEVYVLPEEQGINAFAAGNSPSDAAIGVTSGCMRLLTRDELQGVIAHEFSHILNGDMRLGLRLIGIVNGILCLAIIGRILLRTRGRRNPLPIVGLVLLVIGSIGVFFGRLIKSAVSRQREFLADASAVQFTRNPDGLASALKKIGGLAYGSRLLSERAEEASHLFFSNGLKESWFGLMSTHPPLEDRIRLLDPSWDGRFQAVVLPVAEPPAAKSRPPAIPSKSIRAPGLAGVFGVPALAGVVINVQTVLPRIGAPTPGHLQYAANFQATLPEATLEATREPLGATALIYALLLSTDSTTRENQLQQLQERIETEVYQEVVKLLPGIPAVAAQAKLPLVLLTLPALRRLSAGQFEKFAAALQFIIESDREVDLFEYTLQKIVLRHLEPHFRPAKRAVIQYYSMKPLAPDCSILLSALARMGHEEITQMESAFRLGVQQLERLELDFQFLEAAECNLPQIDSSLNRLSQAAPQIKRNVLLACAHTVAADGIIQSDEAELLRAIADTLDCPIPPFIEGV